ncbi:MAG: Hpt domain-containing protein [Acidobacteria bacterium]|nr:Hpt domain-containing protein [Acidobacteriota bacterium]
MDRRKYLELFLNESREHLEGAGKQIEILISGGTGKNATLKEFYRNLHSLKGMCAAMEFRGLTELLHAMEELLEWGRAGNSSRLLKTVGTLETGLEEVGALLGLVENGDPDPSSRTGVLKNLRSRKKSRKIDHESRRPRNSGGPSEKPEVSFPSSIRVQMESLDRLLESTAEVVIHRLRLQRSLPPASGGPPGNHQENLRQSIDRLRAEVMEIRLVPFGSIAGRLRDAALDLAKRREKRIEMEILGTEISIDRSTLERLLDPLFHLIRNCVDHGIEPRQERLRAGKKSVGRLLLLVTRIGSELRVELRDDGRGIDPALLKDRAVEGGWLTPQAADRLGKEEILRLVTLPGVSTHREPDEVSGRGVGMDVVATRIRALGGTLDIDSWPGRGTAFRMQFPLTLAILDSLLVQGKSGTYVFPLHQIESIQEVPVGELERGRNRCLRWKGAPNVDLYSLDEILGVGENPHRKGTCPVLFLRTDGSRRGLLVGSILGRRDLVLRPLGSPLETMREFSGAAILDDGGIALLLNARTLLPETPGPH